MICHQVRIPYTYGETIKIVPIFDVHLGSAHCDVKHFKSDLAATDHESTYFLTGGDLLDSIITSDVKRYRKSGDDTEGDAIIDEQVERMYQLLQPYQSHILGIGEGNHESNIVQRCATNPSKRLAKMLDAPFLGFTWILKLFFNENGGRGRLVQIRGHHGWGGGSRTQGADLTKYSRDMQYWDADVFLYGHVHRKQSDRIPRMGTVGTKFVAKPKLMGICGGYLKTFGIGTDPTYSEIKGYPPSELGHITLNIKPDGKWVKMWIDT